MDKGQEYTRQGRQLLEWAQTLLADKYGLTIDDFGHSWRDGIAFNCLIHHLSPGLVDTQQVFRRTPSRNLQSAFTVAERELGIARTLSPHDLEAEEPDQVSVMRYVAELARRDGELETAVIDAVTAVQVAPPQRPTHQLQQPVVTPPQRPTHQLQQPVVTPPPPPPRPPPPPSCPPPPPSPPQSQQGQRELQARPAGDTTQHKKARLAGAAEDQGRWTRWVVAAVVVAVAAVVVAVAGVGLMVVQSAWPDE